jgi:hypothetical protein
MSKVSLGARPFLAGAAGSLALLSLYFFILAWAQSLDHALENLRDLWPWITALVLGFGTQIGLFDALRTILRWKQSEASASVAATGGISSVSMAACCAHHVADVAPALGLSAAALFLVKYQTLFLLLGVLSNLIGVTFMLRTIQRHGVLEEVEALKFFSRYDLERGFRAVFALAATLFVAFAFYTTVG